MFEKLVGVRSLEKAIEIQTEYVQSTHKGFVAQATKTRELYTSWLRTASRPSMLFARPRWPRWSRLRLQLTPSNAFFIRLFKTPGHYAGRFFCWVGIRLIQLPDRSRSRRLIPHFPGLAT